ncbi:hypothetical protein QOZ80_6BG0487740 [Eleusine coracana subsp. coracana]|nr:hypothetical protein QOZ80_6BG0487740 [Eleusine coracana subsp. coracana]
MTTAQGAAMLVLLVIAAALLQADVAAARRLGADGKELPVAVAAELQPPPEVSGMKGSTESGPSGCTWDQNSPPGRRCPPPPKP